MQESLDIEVDDREATDDASPELAFHLLDEDGALSEATEVLSARVHVEATLRERERQLAALIANLPGWAYRCRADGDWTPEFVSEGIRPLAGHHAADFLAGKVGFRSIVHPADRDTISADVERALMRHRPFQLFYRIERAGGGTRWVHECGHGVYDRQGRLVAIEGFVSDVTALKRAEQKLREASEKKDAFLAMLAHELKTPLAPLRSGVELLKLGGLSEPARDHVLEMLDRQVVSMTRMVDDLLELARVMRGMLALHREAVDLSSIVSRAIETSSLLVQARHHELHVELPSDGLIVEGDPVRLAQVVSNLVNNAAKYTTPGGSIWIALWRDGDEAWLRVRDNGAGIPPEMLERVFEMFEQVDAETSRAQGGLGIGLSLVKRIVELHGGSVRAMSRGPGTGSTFLVRLPLGVATSSAAVDDTPVAQPRRKIVVVDDNHDAADTTRLLLELAGNRVWVAYDGASGLALVEQHHPDAMLLDIGMPELDGFEVARRIRSHPELGSMRLVALTGWGQLEDRRATEAAGFDAHLVKPISMQDLQAALAGPAKTR